MITENLVSWLTDACTLDNLPALYAAAATLLGRFTQSWTWPALGVLAWFGTDVAALFVTGATAAVLAWLGFALGGIGAIALLGKARYRWRRSRRRRAYERAKAFIDALE